MSNGPQGEAERTVPSESPAAGGSLVRRVGRAAVRLIRRLASACLVRVLGLLRTQDMESLVTRLVARRAALLPPDEALRFLFRLDTGFYRLQGQKALQYGGGIHTKHRHTGYHKFFLERIRPGDRVLDVGCGTGALARAIADGAQARVVAIDVDPDKIAEARARNAHPRVEYHVADATQELPEGPFDTVVLSNVLEHLDERPLFLKRLLQAARPSRLLIRVPLLERDWRVPLKRELGVEWRLTASHRTEYTVDGFSQEIEAAGLEISHQQVRWGEIWAEVAPSADTGNACA